MRFLWATYLLIGINGSKEDCESIKTKLSEFIKNDLKMELSEEKTLITHSNNYARFLSYDIRIRRDENVKKDKNGIKKRSLNNKVEINVPFKDKIDKFLFGKNIIKIKNSEVIPCEREALFYLTDLEIIDTFNSELRGLCNYYGLASNFGQFTYFSYLMEYSCLKTLAGKHRSTIAKIKTKFKDGRGKWGVPYETKTGKKRMYFAEYQKCKVPKFCNDTMQNSELYHKHSTTTFESRLKSKVCEICGIDNATTYAIHHINKVKNLKGIANWKRIMIAKRRKTIVVCENCHKVIHGKVEND